MMAGILAPAGAEQLAGIRCPDPTYMAIDKWAEELYNATGIGELPRLELFARWQDWADRVASHPEFERRQVPFSIGFDTWKEWAYRVYGILMS
jgi:hypothetical protein